MGFQATITPCKRARLPSEHDASLFDTVLICRPDGGSQPQQVLIQSGQGEATEIAACAFLLASYSPFFERALAKEWGSEGKRLEVTAACPESFGHLLEWMHSLGKALPQDPAALGALLVTAHAFGVEQCVAAAATALADEAFNLSWQLTSDLLALLAGKECEGQAAAAALTALRSALLKRLLLLLGKVDDALNDPGQKSRIQALPLLVLEELLASNSLRVDCEETVFCAVAEWMDASKLAPEEEWDRDKEVLVEALVHAADARLARACTKDNGASLPAKFARRPSYKQLTRLEFVSEIDVSSIVDGGSAYGASHYWAGHRWQASCDLSEGGDGIGVYLFCEPPPGGLCANSGLIGRAAVGPRLNCTLAVADHSGGSGGRTWSSACTGSEEVMRSLQEGRPGHAASGVGTGWDLFEFTGTIDGAPITRANFRAPGSPVVKDGKMTVKANVTLMN